VLNVAGDAPKRGRLLRTFDRGGDAMLIENGFTVQAPADDLWRHLLDVERIVPCMPGAELTEVIDERRWKGTLHATFGPVSMAFAGTVTMEVRDDAAHRVVLKAAGREQKGKGAANARVTAWLEPAHEPGSTALQMQADVTLSGAAAQLSRGLLPEISKKLTQQFADCLQAGMAAEAAPRAPAGSSGSGSGSASPVGGARLGASALWATILAFFRRVFGGGREP
jgi:carbon monoxide dehydrogenase subunit G